MGPIGVVAASPPLDVKLRVPQREKPMLIQALVAEPAVEAFDVGVLDRFLAACPAEARIAVEFRDRSWHREEVYDLLRRHRAAFAWTEWRDLARVTPVTTDFLYLRWMGHRETITSFDREQIDRSAALDEWSSEITRALPEVRTVYGYFNNHWAGHSPASAAGLLRRLGVDPIEPQSLWPQGDLWSGG